MIGALALVFLAAAAISTAATVIVRQVAHRLGALDRPAGRKAHDHPVPRLGGVGIAAAWGGSLAIAALTGEPLEGWLRATPIIPVAIAALVVFAVGLWDDLRPLPAGPKLLGGALAAAIVAGAPLLIERVTVMGVTWHLGWLAIAATVAWILTITNAFNLVDGLDGLAAGLAIIAGATCTAIVVIRGDYPTALLLVALLGGLVGFLPFNFNPASIFLGDAGSLLTGFILAVTAITGWQKGATALAVGVPLLVFAFPIVETVTTVIRRATHAGLGLGSANALRAILRPDHEHIHYRLMSLGLSHRNTVLVLYALALCLSGVALLTMERP